MIVVAGTVRVRADRRDQAVEAVRRMSEASRVEPGNRAYRFAWDVEDPDLAHVFEEWESADALDAHFAMPHMAEFAALLGEVVVGDAEFTRYEVEGSRPLFG